MIERLVGLQIVNQEQYKQYREGMMPLLEEYGGSFGIDVVVSEVLRSPSKETFNRLFTIRFPSETQLNGFFADARYLAVRDEFFVPAVESTNMLSKGIVVP